MSALVLDFTTLMLFLSANSTNCCLVIVFNSATGGTTFFGATFLFTGLGAETGATLELESLLLFDSQS